jgi:hypothetical protein
MPFWKKAEKRDEMGQPALISDDDRKSLDQWLSSAGVERRLDLADATTFPDAAPEFAEAAAAALSGAEAPRALPALLIRMACRGRPLIGALTCLDARQLRLGVEQALPIGETFPELLAFLQDPPAGTADALLRRIAYAMSKARPDEFWPRFHHARRTLRPGLKCILIRSAVARFPGFTSEACILLSGFDGQACALAPVSALITDLARNHADKVRDWGTVTLMQAALRSGSPDLVASLFRSLDPSRISFGLRAHVLREVALALKDNPSPLAREERLRVLATMVVCDPLFIPSAEAVGTLNQLLASETPSQATNVQTAFCDGEKALLRDGIDIDVAHASIQALVMPDWLGIELYNSFTGHPPAPMRQRTLLTPAEPLSIPGARYWAEFNDDDPVKYVTSLTTLHLGGRAQYLYEVEDVVFYPDSGLNVFADRDGSVYRHISYGRASFFSGRRWENINTDYVGKDALALTVGYGDDNYCHFMFDRAPLLELTCLQSPNPPEIILIEDKLVNWCRQLLAQIGCTIPVHGLKHSQPYALSKVRAFNATQHPGQFWPEAHKAFFRRFRPDDAAAPTRRIFIVRPQGRRGIVNEDEIHGLATERGFELVRLETLTLAEQIRLFAETRFVTGVHGAGFSNIVFSRPGTRVLELVKKGYITGSYNITAGRMDMIYAILLDESAAGDAIRGETKFDDLTIDAKKFTDMIDRLDAEGR